jgi:hypothetical protein
MSYKRVYMLVNVFIIRPTRVLPIISLAKK